MKNKTAWIIGGFAVVGLAYYINRKKIIEVQVLPATTQPTTPAVTKPAAAVSPLPVTNGNVNTGIVPPITTSTVGLKPGTGVAVNDSVKLYAKPQLIKQQLII